MAQKWEADKMLDVYIYDYLEKRKLHESAEAFKTEAKVATDRVAIDAPGGFLLEWWSVFWDIFIARTNVKHSEAAAAYIERSEAAAAYIETQQMKAKEHQEHLQMQHLHHIHQRNALLQRRDPNNLPVGSSANAINADGVTGKTSASTLAMKMYEEPMRHSHSTDPGASPALLDASRIALLKSVTDQRSQLVQGNSPSVSGTLQQIQGRSQLNMKSLPTEPSSIYGRAILQSKSGLGGQELNQGVTAIPLNGWPLTGIDQLHQNLGLQVQKPNMQKQNQFYLPSQQQQALTHAQAQGSLGVSPNYGLVGLPRGNLITKDGQVTRNEGSIGSPGQMASPKMKMPPMQQTSSQQQDQSQQQKQQNNRKRKHSSSGPANSTGTGNTGGPSPSSPASSHTVGDGMATATSLQHVNSAQKSMMMYGAEATGGLPSSTDQLDDLEHFGDVGSLDDNVESFLQNDAGQTLTEHKTESSKGFSFGEIGCIQTRIKVTACHFSSDGKLVVSAGHDKKAVLWNMDTLGIDRTPEEHQLLITDVRFRPNSTQFATASYDKSVRIWDAANPSYCLHAHTGHTSHVMSLDFHPKKNDLFCFSDGNNEIRYCNISPFQCTRISKQVGSTQVRFHPVSGHSLAAASDKIVSIFDVETDRQIHSFQGHSGDIIYLCWDLNGDYLASLSEDSVKVWSLASGECIHDLDSTGNQFYSCVFHPSYTALLVIGGMQSLELWNIAENKCMTVPAHDNVIASLAQSPVTGMVASASHDTYIKLWK